MSNPTDYPPFPAGRPLLDRDQLLAITGSPTRWEILRALYDGGEGWGAADIAKLTDITSSAASKHMALLVEAGICVQGRGRLYRLAPQFQPPPGSTPRILDFGHIILRLDLQPPAS